MDRYTNLEHVRFHGRPDTRRRSAPFETAFSDSVRTRLLTSERETLDVFIAKVLERGGLQPSAYRASPLHRRLPACLRALKVQTTRQAFHLLTHQPRLLPKVIDSLMIPVSEFFRDGPVFEAVRFLVIPALATMAVERGPLRLWSAGCSCGAELYSMAILLDEAGLLDRCELVGTDCRETGIARALEASYLKSELRSMPPRLQAEYFERNGNDVRLTPRLRGIPRWKQADLVSGIEPGPWDAILWRNLAMYLRDQAARPLWDAMAAALRPGGILIVGKAERPPRDLDLEQVARCIYRKGLSSRAPGVMSA